MRTLRRLTGPAALAALALCTPPASADRASAEALLHRIALPPGFTISVYAEVPGARQIAIGNALGTVFVGTRYETVYAVIDRNRDHVADKVFPFNDGLNAPSGLAFVNGDLYVSEQHRLTRYMAAEYDVEHRDMMPEVVYEGFVDNPHHGTRYTRLGPDGMIYVALGVPCNICEPKNDSDAIVRFAPDSNQPEVFARGVRNSVGMDFHPKTGELFFTDNGVDGLGDDIPPGELNHAPESGMHFGFPYYAGGAARHPDWAERKPPMKTTPPVLEFNAHVAALGMHFYRGKAFPKTMQHDAFVAQHGSWNRSTPIGYRVMRVRFDDKGMPEKAEVFASGWLPENDVAWGRPVDVAELPDGSLLVSDDYQGVIYRIAYEGGEQMVER